MQAQLDLFDASLIHPPRRRRGKRSRRNGLLEVMTLALVVARRTLGDYSCPKSKRVFTQPQLLACLVLKAYKKLTYRSTVDLLAASDDLRQVLGLGDRVPAHTTLKEFFDRVIAPAPALLESAVGQVLALLQERGLVIRQVAADSTGIETSSASAHFVSRAKRKREGYVKLSLAVACTSIVLVAMTVSMGPSNDLCEARPLLWQTGSRVCPDFVFMDKGYDAEWPHTFCAALGACSYIPPIAKSQDGTIKSGPQRVRCSRHRPYHAGLRWHAESFISGMKRTCGSTLGSRSRPALIAEAGLKALAYAIHR
jgi:hypothetical protein